MSLFCYIEPVGRRKFDSPAKQKYLQTLETKFNRIHEGFVGLFVFFTLINYLSKNWIVFTLYCEYTDSPGVDDSICDECQDGYI